MSILKSIMQSAADRIAFGLGSNQAAGRLEIRAAAAEVRKQWGRYVGREGIRQPTPRDVRDFLSLEYGFECDGDLLTEIAGKANAGVDEDHMHLAVARLLLREGILQVYTD